MFEASLIQEVARAMLDWMSTQMVMSSLLFVPVAALTLWRGRRWAFMLYGFWLLVLLRLIVPPGLTAPWGVGEPTIQWPLALTQNAPELNPTVQISANPEQVNGLQTHQSTVDWASLPTTLFCLWLAGVLFFGGLFIYRSSRVTWLLTRAVPLKNEELQRRLREWKEALGIRRPIRLLTSSSSRTIAVPCTVGFLRPQIYLPQGLIQTSDMEVLEAVLAHEVAHIRRWDYLWMRVQGWIQVIYFFNPLAWIASGQLNRTRETLCDQLVLSRGTISRSSYGRSLLAVLNLQTKAGAGMLLPMPALGRHPRRCYSMRMEEILHYRLPKRRSRVLALCATLAAAVLLLPLAPGVVAESSATADDSREMSDEQRLKKTADDLRRISLAVHEWSVDALDNGQGAIGSTVPKPHVVDGVLPLSNYDKISLDDLKALLEPKYIEVLPTEDGWGNAYDVRVNTQNLGSKQLVVLRSAGRDGVFEGDGYAIGGFASTEADRDIVHADGYFVTWPVF